jgi:hypothetical protein
LNNEAGEITYLNHALFRRWGIPGPNPGDWWPLAYPDPEYRQWVAELARMELNVRCKDGALRTFIAGAASLRKVYGTPGHLYNHRTQESRGRACFGQSFTHDGD